MQQLFSLLMIALLLVTVLTQAPNGRWAFAVSFALLAMQLGLHLFERERMQRWFDQGWLFAADGAALGMTLLAASALSPLGYAALFAVIFAAVTVQDRRRAMIAAAAVAAQGRRLALTGLHQAGLAGQPGVHFLAEGGFFGGVVEVHVRTP